MDLARDDRMHLDCVRGGGCCRARVPVTPWEIAVLARAQGIDARACRERDTDDAGTCLRRAGGACGRLGAAGCSVHAARPLACRLFPLGRRLDDGRVIYHQDPRAHRCAALCPSYATLAPRRVGDWLSEQDVAAGERAHDAYGRLVCGLLGQAAELLPAGTAAGPVLAVIRQRAGLPATVRAALLPRPWYDLATAPPLAALVDDPAAFVLAHAERILAAVAAGGAGDAAAAAVLLATIAFHLGEPLGIAPTAALALVERAAAA